MPLMQIYPEPVSCPHCGAQNSVPVFKFVQWWNDPRNLEHLLNGELNIFECQSCKKLGWVDQEIKIHLEKEHVILKPIPPEDTPKVESLLGTPHFFYEPLGQPLVLLKEFIDKYEKEWQERNKGNISAYLSRQLD